MNKIKSRKILIHTVAVLAIAVLVVLNLQIGMADYNSSSESTMTEISEALFAPAAAQGGGGCSGKTCEISSGCFDSESVDHSWCKSIVAPPP